MKSLNLTKNRLALAAAAATGLLFGAVHSQAAPLQNFQILAGTSASGPFTPTLTGISANTTIYYEVVAESAASGTSNAETSKKPNGTTDGVGTFPGLSLSGNGTFESSTVASNFQGTGYQNGTTGGASITIYGTHSGSVNDDGAQIPLDTGSFQTGVANNVISLVDLLNGNHTTKTGIIYLSGSIQTVTSTTESSADPLIGVTGVTFNDVWDGTSSANWNSTDLNFNSGTTTFAPGAGAIFGNYAANGTTPVNANNTVIAIQQSGVLPASTVFSNTSSTPYRFTTTGSVGIGTGSVTINGGGTVAFSNTNTYTGGTFITDGTLKAAAGSLASTGAVTIGSQGELSVGDGTSTTVGTLHTGAQTWTAGGTLGVKLNGDGTNDQVAIGGALTLTGSGTPFTISVAPGASSITTSEQYEVATFTSLAGYTGTQPTADSGSAGAVTVPTGSNDQFALNTSAITGIPSGDFSLSLESLSNGTGDALFVDVDYSSTPEPTTALLGLTAVAPMLLARRRRNRAANQA